MANANLAYRPNQIVARRVKEARTGRGWSQEDLASSLRELGYEIQQSSIARLETSKRAVSLDDLFALAAALQVPPVHLLAPLEDTAPVAVTPKVTLPAALARAWFRGYPVPVGPDADDWLGVDFKQIPRTELRAKVARYLRQRVTREASPLIRAIYKPSEELVDEMTDAILEGREREEALSG